MSLIGGLIVLICRIISLNSGIIGLISGLIGNLIGLISGLISGGLISLFSLFSHNLNLNDEALFGMGLLISNLSVSESVSQ